MRQKTNPGRLIGGPARQWGWIALIGLMVFGVTVLAAAARADGDSVSGDWFTQGVEDGTFIQLIYHRNPDGHFRVMIRALDQCRLVGQHEESGDWHFADGAIDQVTTLVQGEKRGRHDHYRIDGEIGASYRLYDPQTGLTWIFYKVNPDFDFPTRQECAVS